MVLDWKDDFKVLYKQRGQQKYGIRLFALWKLQEGLRVSDVCTLLKKTHQTIHRWRQRYESGGIESLLSLRPGRGRKAFLSDKAVFARDIQALGEQRKGRHIRCQDIVEMVQEKYNVSYSNPGMYSALHRLGLSWISSRSKHPQQDQPAQDAFKKTF